MSRKAEEVLEELVSRVLRALPHADLGLYLHGSASEATTDSVRDIDVLALANQALSDDDRAVAKGIASDLAGEADLPIDFHIHRLSGVIANPYVDLRRTGKFLGGRDIRELLPEPTHDALARESVLHCCSMFASRFEGVNHLPLKHPNPDDQFYGRVKDDLGGLTKKLSWLASGLLAARHGYAPTGSRDALRALAQFEPELGSLVSEAVFVCREEWGLKVPVDSSSRERLRHFCDLLLALENEALSAFIDPAGSFLGPKCRELIEANLPFPH